MELSSNACVLLETLSLQWNWVEKIEFGWRLCSFHCIQNDSGSHQASACPLILLSSITDWRTGWLHVSVLEVCPTTSRRRRLLVAWSWWLWRSAKGWVLSAWPICTTSSTSSVVAVIVRWSSGGWLRARSGSIAPFCLRVSHNRFIHCSLDLRLPITMVDLLPDPLVHFDKLNQFLVQLRHDTWLEEKKEWMGNKGYLQSFASAQARQSLRSATVAYLWGLLGA